MDSKVSMNDSFVVQDNLSSFGINMTSDMQHLVDHYHAWSKGLRLYVTPFIIFGGTAGNLLTIAVVLSHHFRNSPSSIPLITLAFVDIGVLYFNLLDVWLGALLGNSLQYTRDINASGCKFSTFITVFLTHYSSWILVLINFDRVVSVYKPLKARTWCSRRHLAIALVVIMFVLGTISLHLFWTTTFHADRESDRCQYNDDLLGVHGHLAWLTIDASLFVFVPFVLILGCNISIVSSLIKARQKRKETYHVQNVLPSDSTTSITTMLMTISIVFLLTTSPLTVCYQFYDDLMLRFQYDPVGKALWYDLIINTVLVLVCYSNNAVNFLLYCVSGTKFRLALSDMISGKVGKTYRRQSTFTFTGQTTTRTSVDYLGQSDLMSMDTRNNVKGYRRAQPSCSVDNGKMIMFSWTRNTKSDIHEMTQGSERGDICM